MEVRSLSRWTPDPDPAERLAFEVGILAGRLAELLGWVFAVAEGAGAEGAVADGRSFLEGAFREVAGGRPLAAFAGGPLDRRPPAGAAQPLDRLADGLGLSPVELDLVLLAGLPEEHEGLAECLAGVHPRGQPRPTAGLAAQLLCRSPAERRQLRRVLADGPAARSGLLILEDGPPFYARSLELPEALWAALAGAEAWPRGLRPEAGRVATAGLESWFAGGGRARALAALRSLRPCTVLVAAEDEGVAFGRGAALAAEAGLAAARLRLPESSNPELEGRAALHCLARGVIPVLCLPRGDGPGPARVPVLDGFPLPAVVCGRAGATAVNAGRPLVAVDCEPLRAVDRQRMWAAALPALEADAGLLAARYPVEPFEALAVAGDLAHLEAGEGRGAGLADVAASMRARSSAVLGGGVKRIRPRAGWDHLVLPEDRLEQLREAVDRLLHQGRVLDDWGFLSGRRGARGVRMLFTGPPGTGKTLSAEVLAGALQVDLLAVDLSRVVSKWIGETEKNLAEVFETAERARAVLLFDEADALFGKRTEVSDAHDRYANLETAYLLSRLERFEGLAVLSTNLRQNIDPAFLRRLEFVISFEEPGRDERVLLWRRHLPQGAPLAPDVDLGELAALYPMVGGLIRNAAVAAAFLAAADGGVLDRTHFVRAIRREHEKAGKAFPGLPAGPANA